MMDDFVFGVFYFVLLLFFLFFLSTVLLKVWINETYRRHFLTCVISFHKDEGTILQNATGTNEFLKVVPLKLAISLCPWAQSF